MNVEIGTGDSQFLFWEYLFQIFGIVSLRCASLNGQTISATLRRNTKMEVGKVMWQVGVGYSREDDRKNSVGLFQIIPAGILVENMYPYENVHTSG